jgi:hypothetical protein
VITQQPYSTGPLTRWSPPFPVGCTLPAVGTVTRIDNPGPELAILMCLVAPPEVQREARARGERALMMTFAPGLRERIQAGPPLFNRTNKIKGR